MRSPSRSRSRPWPRAMAAALDAAGAPRPASIGLILTDDAELAGAQRRRTWARPVRPMSCRSRCCRRGVPPTRPSSCGLGHARSRCRPAAQHLGDIVVSVERAIEQAETGRGGQTGDVRWSPADELRLLVTHGTLHVCGWDHAEPAEEARDARARAAAARRLGQPSRATQQRPGCGARSRRLDPGRAAGRRSRPCISDPFIPQTSSRWSRAIRSNGQFRRRDRRTIDQRLEPLVGEDGQQRRRDGAVAMGVGQPVDGRRGRSLRREREPRRQGIAARPVPVPDRASSAVANRRATNSSRRSGRLTSTTRSARR